MRKIGKMKPVAGIVEKFFPHKCSCHAIRFQLNGLFCDSCRLTSILNYYNNAIEQLKTENRQLRFIAGGLKHWVRMHQSICNAKMPEGREDEIMNALNVHLMRNVIHSNKWHVRLKHWHCCLPMKNIDRDFMQCRVCRNIKMKWGFTHSIPPKDPDENMNQPYTENYLSKQSN